MRWRLKPGGFLSIARRGLLAQAIMMLSGPLLARMLGERGRGEMAFAVMASNLLAMFAVGGLTVALTTYIAARGVSGRALARRYAGTFAVYSLIPSTLAGAAVYGQFHQSDARLQWSLVASATAWTCCLQWVVAGLLQGEGNNRLVNRFWLTGVTTYVALVTAGYASGQVSDPILVLVGYTANQAVMIALGLHWLAPEKFAKSRLVSDAGEDLLRRAKESFFSGSGLLDGLFLDSILVGVLLGSASLGSYVVASSCASVTLIVTSGLAAALLPKVAAAQDSATRRAVVSQWLGATVWILGAAIVLLQLVLEPLIRVAFGSEFLGAVAPGRWLVFAWAAMGMRRMLMAIAQAGSSRGRRGASIVEGSGTVLAIGLVVAGASRFGMVGAAAAMTGTGLVACAWLGLIVRRELGLISTGRRRS